MYRTLLIALSVFSLATTAQAQTFSTPEHDYQISTYVDGLMQPWSMTWLPNGDMLVTEKPGRLRIVRDGELLSEPVVGVPDVYYQGQGGLFDVVLHPDFESNNLIYLTYATATSGNSATAIVRGTYSDGQLSNVENVFVAQSSGRSHYGGRLVFDQNGYMFLTAGDRQASPMGDAQAHPAQDLGNHAGVIIRLHDDGSVPDDNPFVDQPGAMPEIWSYGHRNPQGLAIHPMTGDLWENEHGPQGGDELNRIEPGQNYGWPVIGYGVNYGGARIHNSTNQPGMTRPAHYWVPSIATSGLMIYTGEQFPDWQGDIFVGGMVGEQLAKLSMGEDGMAVTGETTMVSNMGRIRDVRQGPNGYIYLAIEDRRGGSETPILRLEPAD